MALDIAKSARTTYAVVFRVVCMILAVILLFVGIGFFFRELNFSLHSTTATATVESDPDPITVGGRRTRHREYAFDYAFEVDGRTYTSRGSTRTEPDRTITIYYERGNPERSRTKPASVGLGIGIVLMGIVGTLYAFDPFKWFWRTPSVHEEVEAEMEARRRRRGE
jgi:hypothetical protein